MEGNEVDTACCNEFSICQHQRFPLVGHQKLRCLRLPETQPHRFGCRGIRLAGARRAIQDQVAGGRRILGHGNRLLFKVIGKRRGGAALWATPLDCRKIALVEEHLSR